MKSAKQLSKCAESLRTVKAHLDKQIVNLKRYQTSLMHKHDVPSSVEKYYKWFTREYEKGITINSRHPFCDLHDEVVTSCALHIPERIWKYRYFNVSTMTGPIAARLLGYQMSMNKVIVSHVKFADYKSFIALLDSFLSNTVVQDAIEEISSRVCPSLKESDLQYWHAPLLESVLGLCNGVLKSIGLEYMEAEDEGNSFTKLLSPQYPDEVAYPVEASVKSATLTLLDALQLRELLADLIHLFTQNWLAYDLEERL